jgi:lipopolysaccharide/colanic/teichoic acid biosynthesis glycosyltransferase
MSKRLFDAVLAGAGLIVLSPLLVAIGIWIRLDSKGPAIFRQIRVGRSFAPFVIYKFRTMSAEAGAPITTVHDRRITRAGRYLRATKLDELPQLFNVLKGDMSFVGPRPEIPRYVELFRADYTDVLRVRPGVTDLASLKYRDESALLGEATNPEQDYVDRVLPDKIRLAKLYVAHSSVRFDLVLIVKTVGAVVFRRGGVTAAP